MPARGGDRVATVDLVAVPGGRLWHHRHLRASNALQHTEATGSPRGHRQPPRRPHRSPEKRICIAGILARHKEDAGLFGRFLRYDLLHLIVRFRF
jgi:hypothetical protein